MHANVSQKFCLQSVEVAYTETRIIVIPQYVHSQTDYIDLVVVFFFKLRHRLVPTLSKDIRQYFCYFFPISPFCHIVKESSICIRYTNTCIYCEFFTVNKGKPSLPPEESVCSDIKSRWKRRRDIRCNPYCRHHFYSKKYSTHIA